MNLYVLSSTTFAASLWSIICSVYSFFITASNLPSRFSGHVPESVPARPGFTRPPSKINSPYLLSARMPRTLARAPLSSHSGFTSSFFVSFF